MIIYKIWYYKHLSVDKKMYNYKFKPVNVRQEMPKARANKTGFNIIIVHFYILLKLNILRYDT